MSLFGLGMAAAGIYGLAMAFSEMSAESARQRLHDIEIKEGHVDVIKHFDLIVAMVEVRPLNGILLEDGYKTCQDLLMYELINITKKDLKKFEQHYKKVRKQQIREHKAELRAREKEINKLITNKIMSSETKRFDRINSFENINTTIKRCNQLYNDTPWKRLAKRPAKVIKTPDGKTKEMWFVKDTYDIGRIYKECNKMIDYEVY